MRLEAQHTGMPYTIAGDDPVLISGLASYKTGMARIKGELSITSDRLLFKIASREEPLVVLTEIDKIVYSKTGFFIKTGFILYSEGRAYKFNVSYPKDWVELIEYLFLKNGI